MSHKACEEHKILHWQWIWMLILILLRCRKLIHHRKETLARRSSSSASHKQGLPSSSSEISLSQTPPPPNGLTRDYGRQGSMPLSGSMDNMPGEQGFYQVAHPHSAHLNVLYEVNKQDQTLRAVVYILWHLRVYFMQAYKNIRASWKPLFGAFSRFYLFCFFFYFIVIKSYNYWSVRSQL